jgi:CubicO group peptidase (beta-lactamase class C family)
MAIRFTPGERWQYSGEGYSYLQSVVTHLTGRVDPTRCGTYEGDLKVCATDIDTYMKAQVLAPFGMTSSGYVWNDLLEAKAARPHDAKGAFFAKGHASAVDAARYAAAGGLFATATDYARFLIEVIAPRETDAFRLTRKSLDEMTRPAVKVSNTPPSSWALGWQVLHTDTGDVIAHGGDNPGFHSFSAASIARGTGMVVMTNGDSGPDVIKQIVFGDTMRRILAR